MYVLYSEVRRKEKMLGRSDEKFKVKILMKHAQDIDDWASIHISIHPIGSNEGFAFVRSNEQQNRR
jgi:hypothetical protein